ncbi:LSU ribosomal protein L21E, partial [Giardia duodenalis]
VKTALDGTTTCVDVATGCTDANHFKADDDSACYLCSDTSGDNPTTNKGIAQCKACTKQKGAAPECSACLDGYFFSQGSCSACGANCATCSEATNPNKCLSCKAGYFLVDAEGGKKCVACDSIPDGGREGCSACSNTDTFKCTNCKPNYRRQLNGDASDDYTCTRACEDPTACDAIVLGASGEMTYYCSQCRQQ